MKLFSTEKVTPGMMLTRSWFNFILRRFPPDIYIAFALYIPWIFTGSYYDPMRRSKRFGWRIPRVLFEIGLDGGFQVIHMFYQRWYQTVIKVPKLRFRKFFWYEAI